MQQVMLVCYDISADKTRYRVDRLLSQYGERLQFSVFELVISKEDFTQLRLALRRLVDPDTDAVNYYPICLWCRPKTVLQGYATLPETEGYQCIC
ncbi:CRISPR-associated endonuclease Cas2 [Vibrio metschnikovii]|uniref:CRISPR-associated endonuclease Cas2 n=1 Tax=Vibrio metschnikovii TaxID=28172 RepID=UPI001C2F8A84|nr:CRISPR-associated endonuclease Cas2 [Vibrio metschnikovii]